MQKIARTIQKPEDEWRRKAPPLIFWFLCPKQNLHCYTSYSLPTIKLDIKTQELDGAALRAAPSNSWLGRE